MLAIPGAANACAPAPYTARAEAAPLPPEASRTRPDSAERPREGSSGDGGARAGRFEGLREAYEEKDAGHRREERHQSFLEGHADTPFMNTNPITVSGSPASST